MHKLSVGRGTQLIAACVVLGVGVGLVLTARLGSDGYSSLVNGIVRATGVPYAVVNPAVGLSAVLLARVRHVRPGPGTIVHPIVVGSTVNVVLDTLATPDTGIVRVAMLVAGALVLAVGVAGYLDATLGAGPFESLALAVPLSFRLAYILLQAVAATAGWILGADIGPGTLLVVFGVGFVIHGIRHCLLRHGHR
ncbi:MAG: hypothetical protein ACRDQA_12165 [Nocardioidaceae bacterium]